MHLINGVPTLKWGHACGFSPPKVYGKLVQLNAAIANSGASGGGESHPGLPGGFAHCEVHHAVPLSVVTLSVGHHSSFSVQAWLLTDLARKQNRKVI